MKKTLLICVMCLTAFSFCTLTSCHKDDNGDYVDLGLPSGTKWKIENEAKPADAACPLFTYDEAMSKFKGHLPFRDQWLELFDYCTWDWISTDNEYKVTGPNGKFITMPAEGYFKEDGSGPINTDCICYWSATPYDENEALCFGIPRSYSVTDPISICKKAFYLSVRLIEY